MMWRVAALACIVTVAVAQRVVAPPPAVVPGTHGCLTHAITHWKITNTSEIESAWRPSHTRVGGLKPGDEVTVLEDIQVTRKPDRIIATESIPELKLQAGGFFLRYEQFGEEEASIWVNGVWYPDYDTGSVREKDGTGCQRGCNAQVVEPGVKEWWVRLKTESGITGWVLAGTMNAGQLQLFGNLDKLCE
jgi:hypothetical protein